MPKVGVDWTMTAGTGMNISGMTFGSVWMFSYEDGVQRHRVIAADDAEYDW